MPASDNGSYFSRFVLRFVEIIAAGLATAVSGYLIAHLSGMLSAPGPAPTAAVIQAAPSGSTVSSQPAAQPVAPTANIGSSVPTQPAAPTASIGSNAPAPAEAPIASIGSSAPAPAAASAGSGPPAQLPAPAAASSAPSNPPLLPLSVIAGDQRRVPPQEANAPAVTPPGRRAATKPEPARRHMENAVTAAPSPRQQGSFVSRVRAALRNVEADHAEPVLPPQGNPTAAAAAPLSQPGQATDRARPADLSGGLLGCPPAQAQLRPQSRNPNLATPVEIELAAR